jgi:ribose-phosphate pyrophosphokinase
MAIKLIVNSTKGFRGYIYDVDIIKFPAGEINVNILKGNTMVTSMYNYIISVDYQSNDDLLAIPFVKDAVEQLNLDRGESNVNSILEIPYLPYARQDRACNRGEAKSLKVLCNMINSWNFDKVVVVDCHSEVGINLLNNCQHISLENVINNFNSVWSLGYDCLVSPDAGAEKKVNKLAKHLGTDVMYGSKERDLETGRILNFNVDTRGLVNKNKVLIVDDICDGGGTFIPLAKELYKKGINSVDLYVTHGIFSKGLDELSQVFDKIYTTDSLSYHKEYKDKLIVKKLGGIL